MTTPHLSDRMHDLAAEVSAPPTSLAREAVGRRARTLRRRHRAHQVAGGGLLALAVTAAVVTANGLGPDRGPTTATDPDAVTVPALTVDLDGWQVTEAEEAGVGRDARAGDDPVWGSLQVFRRPGDLTGPTVVLRHTAASDVPGAATDEPVVVDGREFMVGEPAPGALTVAWQAAGDSHGTLLAWGLTQDEALAFAAGLQPVDTDIQYPPLDEDFGFTTSAVPAGLEEVQVDELRSGPPVQRRVALTDGAATAEVVTDDRGTVAFESGLEDLLASGAPVEPVTVLGRPAVLAETAPGTWTATWLHDADADATVTVAGADRATVDAVLGGLRELPEAEWDDLVADLPTP